MQRDPEKLGHLPQADNKNTEFIIPVLVTGECRVTSAKLRLDEAIKDGIEQVRNLNQYARHSLHGLQVHALAKTVRDGSWYDVHTIVSGIRYSRSRCMNISEAVQRAERMAISELNDPPMPLTNIRIQALAPTLMLAPEDRASWPYWGYGWYGTDGVDWRSGRTCKGIGDIPDIAEDSWPIPPDKD